MSERLLYSEDTYQIIGAAIEVHKIIGCGFTEPLYQEAFEEELRIRNIPYQREKSFSFTYKGKKLNKEFRPDFVCFEKIIVELKAVSDLADEHFAQVYNYLKATDMKLGILINFGKKSLEYKRIPCSKKW
ncbi:MAG: GxxExxY protein [Bacteroidales bacterium]|nr:GxxExxY protein [Bacteroidales bacterium]